MVHRGCRVTDYQREYTDTVVFLGLTAREAEEDYHQARAAAPETFLGYRVRVASPASWRSLHGLRVHDYFVTERAYRHPDINRAIEILAHSKLVTNPKKNGEQ